MPTDFNEEAASNDTGKASSAPLEPWSDVQVAALLKAIKSFPKDSAPTDKERWAKIASCVPGKTVASCFRKAIELKDAKQAAVTKA